MIELLTPEEIAKLRADAEADLSEEDDDRCRLCGSEVLIDEHAEELTPLCHTCAHETWPRLLVALDDAGKVAKAAHAAVRVAEHERDAARAEVTRLRRMIAAGTGRT